MRYMPIAAVAALALSPSPAAATWEGKPGLVAYQTVDRLNTIRPDGTHRRPIGDTFDVNGFDWSPNGHAIVWAGTDALWQVRADGTHRRRITSQDFGSVLWSPSYSPDGRTIVFAAETDPVDPDDTSQGGETWALWTIRPDGTDARKLVPGREAVWSHSGRHIRYSQVGGGVGEIKADGTGYRELFHSHQVAFSLDMSPDGRRLAWRDGGAPDTTVRTYNVRTGARTSFHFGRFGVFDIAWAPGGKRLAYIYTPASPKRTELRTVRPDGRGDRRVFTFRRSDSDAVFGLAWQTR